MLLNTCSNCGITKMSRMHETMIATAMIAAGLPAGRFAELVAMADTKPVYPAQPDRPENRRITIVAKATASSLPTALTAFR